MYVHSPPASNGLERARRREQQHLDPNYMAESYFTERLMSDFSLRTLDPAKALLFYTPTWVVAEKSNTVYGKGVQHYQSLIDSLAADPIFSLAWRANRSRHLFWAGGDFGACMWPRDGPMFMTHWGLTTPWRAMVMPHLWRSGGLASVRATETPCTDERDFIIPPSVRAPSLPSIGDDGSASRGVDYHAMDHASGRKQWRCELFFAGAIRSKSKNQRSSTCDDGAGGSVLCYSQGVRAAIFAHHASRKGFCVAERLSSKLLAQSRFCLAPSGEGFGDRLSLVLLSGCVPLIIQPAVRLPFEDLLPYDSFAVRVGTDAVPRLHTLLESISDAEHARMRMRVRRYAKVFNWFNVSSDGQLSNSGNGAGGGLAYDVTRYSLCLRAKQQASSCDELRPSLLSPRVDGSGSTINGHVFGDPSVGRVDPALRRTEGSMGRARQSSGLWSKFVRWAG